MGSVYISLHVEDLEVQSLCTECCVSHVLWNLRVDKKPYVTNLLQACRHQKRLKVAQRSVQNIQLAAPRCRRLQKNAKFHLP